MGEKTNITDSIEEKLIIPQADPRDILKSIICHLNNDNNSPGETIIKTTKDVRQKLESCLLGITPYVNHDNLDTFIREMILRRKETNQEDRLKESEDEAFYRTIVEDLFNTYLSSEFPDLFSLSSKHPFSLNDMASMLCIPTNSDNEILKKIESLKPAISFLLEAILERRNIDIRLENSIEDFKDIIMQFKKIISGREVVKQSNPRIRTFESVIDDNGLDKELNEDITNNRFIIDGPFLLKGLNEDKKNTPKKITLESVHFKIKNGQKQFINWLEDKEVKDAIGIRFNVKTIEDSFHFYQTVIREFIHDSKGYEVRYKTNIINFFKPTDKEFEKRYEGLKEFEKTIRELPIEDFLDENDNSGYFHHAKTVMDLLTSLHEEKRVIFEKEGQYEKMVKKFYKLEKMAIQTQDAAEKAEYLKLADETNQDIIWFRQSKLEILKDRYINDFTLARTELIIDEDIHNPPIITSKNGVETYKLKPKAKKLLTLFDKCIGGVDNLRIIKSTGSPLYLDTKIYLKKGDSTIEISALPSWVYSLMELIAPHDVYNKGKMNTARSKIRGSLIDPINSASKYGDHTSRISLYKSGTSHS